MPATLFQVVQQFGFPSGESGQFSYWLGDPSGVATLTDATTYASTFQSSLAASTNFKALFPSTMTWPVPKISEVDISTGRVTATSVGTGTITLTGSSSSVLPPQVAWVVTLRTAHAGAAHRGRMYFPGPLTTPLTGTGRVNSTAQGQLLTAVSAAFAAAEVVTTNPFLVVYSRLGRSIDPVLSIDIGDVLDTERRRRDKLLENRVSSII